MSAFHRNFTLFSLLVLFLLSPARLRSQEVTIEPPKVSLSEKGLWVESADGFMGFRIAARLQEQLIVTGDLNNRNNYADLRMRRGRMQLWGYFFEKELYYFLQVSADGGDLSVMNYEFRWKPGPHTMISFGQLRPPIDRQFQTISNRFQMVDRSAVSRFFSIGYDLGIMANTWLPLGDRFGFKVYGSITHGEGANRNGSPGGFAYTGRLEVLPFGLFHENGDYSESDLYREPEPKLSLGASFYYNNDAYVVLGDQQWYGLQDDIETLYVDGLLKYRGFSLLSEYMYRFVENEKLPQDAAASSVFANIEGGTGLAVQGGYFLAPTIELTSRYSRLQPNREHRAFNGTFLQQSRIAAGLNKFFLGHYIKLQGQAALVSEQFNAAPNRSYIEILAQFSINF